MRKLDILHNINNLLILIDSSSETVTRKTADRSILNSMNQIQSSVKKILMHIKVLSEEDITYTVLRIRSDDSVDAVFKCQGLSALEEYLEMFPPSK